MSWKRPARPDWVLAIDRGSALWASEEAKRRFDRDELLGRAAATQGHDFEVGTDRYAAYDHPHHPAGPMIENLDRLVRALENEAELTPTGRWLTHRFLLRILEVRIQILDQLRKDPSIEEERIEKPLVLAGAPRTGTTILYSLLAADPNHRAPTGWELLRPAPPPSGDPEERARDPRIELADEELRRPQTVVSGIETIHAYAARNPKECLSAMSFALQSEEFTARYHVPSYATWLETSDMTPAYRMHRLVLQTLQRRARGTAWVLKSPVHLHALGTLFETYPDARVALTHRDPLRVLGSLTSLIANLRYAHSDRVDADEIAAGHHTRYRRSFRELVRLHDENELPAAQLHHSQFADFQTRPLEVAKELYGRFGMKLEASAQDAMRQVLEASPRHGKGEHRYAIPQVEDSAEAARACYAEYQARFSVPNEESS